MPSAIYGSPRTDRIGTMTYRETLETRGGCRIRMMRAGSGPPLLYLHGARGASAWLPFMQQLSQRFDVIVPEHPGFGQSDMPDWLDNVGDLAYFYLDVLEELGLDRVNVLGSSLGGWIAAEIAVRSCARLKSLVLSASAGIHVKGVSKGDIFLWSPEKFVRSMYHDPKLADAAVQTPLSEADQMTEMRSRLATAKLAWQPRLYNPHLAKWLHRIKVPTLILWGDDDKIVPPPYGPAFAGLIPGARLEVIADCGHVPQLEHPGEWVGKIVRFLDEVGS
jgi:pimeloyl-ACP methyl ester carboxylesterase